MASSLQPSASPRRVLVVEDDPQIQRLVASTVAREGLKVDLAKDGIEAIEKVHSNSIDLVLLDIVMPNLDGLSACRRIREFSQVPIMLLTSKREEADILKGFNAGADDYIVKPFSLNVLLARVLAILKRLERFRDFGKGRTTFGELSIDHSQNLVTKNGHPLNLSPLEYELLAYLVYHAGKPISKETLFQEVWGYSLTSGEMNMVEVAIRRLRMKIETQASRPRYIRTKRGFGYFFSPS